MNEKVSINVPKEFSYDECMVYINRCQLECMHRVSNGELYKLISLDNQPVLLKIGFDGNKLSVIFLNGHFNKGIKGKAIKYVQYMFDFGTNLSEFYESIDDEVLKPLLDKYYGLRIFKINHLFEALCWSVIGQQINLKFAYTLKKRFVEKYGEGLNFDGKDYWLFPKPDAIADLDIDDLRVLQFTQRKAEYIIGLAKCFVDGIIKEEELRESNNYGYIVDKLTAIRGIGKWSADYTIMKCFPINCAFPIADVGIHNALKNILKLDKKPSIAEIEAMAKQWKGWESYAAFYLWRSLYD
ncbi:MAG: DNA-3-methyladenine glycosylase family protein [Bacillota bacterium]